MPSLFNVQSPAGLAERNLRGASASMGAQTKASTTTTNYPGPTGLDYLNTAAKAVQVGRGIYQDIKAAKFENATKEYGRQLEMDKDFVPDFKDKKTDIKAYQLAKYNQMTMESTELSLKQAKNKFVMDDMRQKHNMILEKGRAAESLLKMGDATSDAAAGKAFEEAYESINNGVDAKINMQKNRYELFDRDGNKIEERQYGSREEMIGSFAEMIKSQANLDDYSKTYLGERIENTKINANQFIDGTPLYDKEGKFAGMHYTKMVDPNTGKRLPDFVQLHDKDKSTITADEARGRELHSTEEWAKLKGLKKTESEIEENKAQAEAAGKKSRVDTLGSTEKDIRAYMNAYKVDQATALDMIRSDKLNKELMQQLETFGNELISEEMMDRDSKEYSDALVAKKEELIRTGAVIMDRSKPKEKGEGIQEKKKTKEALTPEQKINAKYPAAKHKGASATINGVKYKSDGKEWKKVG